jgi:hypothetical protein
LTEGTTSISENTVDNAGMTDASPHTVHYLVVALDYGQFGIYGGYRPHVDYMDLLAKAQSGPGIASYECGVVILSPHQNNFRMPLRIEIWHQQPPDDRDSWEEITECELTVEDGELRYESPTVASTTVRQVPNGRYAVRVCGRGFVNRGWPGSTEPGDNWRIQLWPTADEFADRRIKAWRPS